MASSPTAAAASSIVAERGETSAPPRLERRLGVVSAASVLVGIVIASGIFRVPSTVAAEVGSVGAMSLLWVLGGAIALCGTLAIAELAAQDPEAGGIFVYLREAYGPFAAYLFGWTDFILVRPGSLAAVALIFASYLGAFVPLSDGGQRLVAAALIALLGAASVRSLNWAAAVQNASSLAKLLALGGLSAAVFLFGHGGGALAGPVEWSPASWGGFGVALVAVLWAYDGWADAAALSGEVRDPGRNLPRAFILGTVTVIVAYLAVNAAYLYVLPTAAMAHSDLVAADAATRVFGRAGSSVVAALVMLATFGSLNGLLLTGSRFVFAMADAGLFFRSVARVHPRWGTPSVAVVVTTALGILFVSSRSFEQLTGLIILGEWPFYTLAVAGVILLRRRRPDAPRPYRSPGYPVLPLVFVAASLALMASAVISTPFLALAGAAITLAGAPIYLVWRRR